MINPPTSDSQPPRDPVWPVTCAGFAALMFCGALLASALSPQKSAATQPTQIPPPQEIIIGIVGSLVSSATLLAADAAYRPAALRRMNLTATGIARGIGIGVAAAVFIVPLVFGASWLTELFWHATGYAHESAHPMLRLFADAPPIQRFGITLLATVIAPVTEELLFRAHLQVALSKVRSLGTLGRSIFAIGVASLLFTLFHVELWMMPPLFVLSVCLGCVFQWTQNIAASITIHACFNATSILYFYLSR